MENKTDFRTNQIYLKTTYECGCIVTTCPPPPACPNHIGKKIKGVREEKRESEGKQLKHSVAEAPAHHEVSDEERARDEEEKYRQIGEEGPQPVKHLGVGVSDNLGEHWKDEVN